MLVWCVFVIQDENFSLCFIVVKKKESKRRSDNRKLRYLHKAIWDHVTNTHVLCTSQLKPPPFGSRGRIGDNRGIRSLLNNKLSPGGGSFDWFRLWVPSPRGAAVKRETGYQFFIWSFQRWRSLKSVDGPHDSCSSQGKDCLALIA